MQQTARRPAGLPGRGLIVWTIYKDPRDFPGLWVLRPQEAREDIIPGLIACVSDCLEPLRLPLEARGLVLFPRHVDDDPAIYETWL